MAINVGLLAKLLGFAKSYWKQILVGVAAVFLFMFTLPMTLLTMIMPSADENKVADYKIIAENVNLDWGELISYDIIMNDNDLSNINPEDTAYKFLIVDYKKYKKVCKEKDESGVCIKYKWKLDVHKTVEGKANILNLLNNLGYDTTGLSVKEVIDKFESLDKKKKYDIKIYSKDIHDLIANLPEDKKEWLNALLGENAIYHMYSDELDLPDNIPILPNDFFIFPTPTLNFISSYFGWRTDPFTSTRTFHYGIDIAGTHAYGQPVIASADGTVFQVNYSDGAAGYNIRIKHYDDEGNEWQTRYCHLSRMYVEVGEKVKQGDVIGAVGNTGRSTGPHLHFEMKFEGQLINPLTYIK